MIEAGTTNYRYWCLVVDCERGREGQLSLRSYYSMCKAHIPSESSQQRSKPPRPCGISETALFQPINRTPKPSLSGQGRDPLCNCSHHSMWNSLYARPEDCRASLLAWRISFSVSEMINARTRYIIKRVIKRLVVRTWKVTRSRIVLYASYLNISAMIVFRIRDQLYCYFNYRGRSSAVPR